MLVVPAPHPRHGLVVLLQWQWGRGAAAFWFLSELGLARSSVTHRQRWAQSLGTPPACPGDLSPLCAQHGGGECGTGLCATGRGVLLGPLCLGQRVLVQHKPWGAVPVPLLSSEARRWLPAPDLCQALLKPPGEVGTVKAPVIAEPFCVASGRQWHGLPALPQILGHAAPCRPQRSVGYVASRSPCSPPLPSAAAASFPAVGLPGEAASGHPVLSPSPVACRERCCSCPGCGRDGERVQCFLTREGRFVPASASFPYLSPRFSSPLAAATERTRSSPPVSTVRFQSWLLPRGSPVTRQAIPAPRPSPTAAAFPGKAVPFLMWTQSAVSCLGSWLHGFIPAPGLGHNRTRLQGAFLQA